MGYFLSKESDENIKKFYSNRLNAILLKVSIVSFLISIVLHEFNFMKLGGFFFFAAWISGVILIIRGWIFIIKGYFGNKN
jgi:hypothetical protein